jgi:hypothetical protein
MNGKCKGLNDAHKNLYFKQQKKKIIIIIMWVSGKLFIIVIGRKTNNEH